MSVRTRSMAAAAWTIHVARGSRPFLSIQTLHALTNEISEPLDRLRRYRGYARVSASELYGPIKQGSGRRETGNASPVPSRFQFQSTLANLWSLSSEPPDRRLLSQRLHRRHAWTPPEERLRLRRLR